MNNAKPVRWMLSFWHPNGGWKDESDFPKVEFWHPDRRSARQEAARVLTELWEERGDRREWVAAGHPDPFEVGAGRHPGGQWVLRYGDLGRGGEAMGTQSANNGEKRTRSAAGAWRGIIDGEELKRTLYEARRTGSRS